MRSVVCALLVVSSPPQPDGAVSCPSERSDAPDRENLRNCLSSAREAHRAGEVRLAASAYRWVLVYARRIYDGGRTGANTAWFLGAGEQIVYYGTEGCGSAADLDAEDAQAVYDSCIELIKLYIADLEQVGALGARSRRALHERLTEVESLRDERPAAEAEAPSLEASPPPPSRPEPVKQEPDPSPVKSVDPLPTPSLPALKAGLGASLALVGASAAGLVAASVFGRRAERDLERESDAPAGAPICEASPRPRDCDDLRRARGLYIASSVGLGVGLAAAVVVGALWLRERRRPRSRVVELLPRLDGVAVRLTARF